jgi:hypothetical protein
VDRVTTTTGTGLSTAQTVGAPGTAVTAVPPPAPDGASVVTETTALQPAPDRVVVRTPPLARQGLLARARAEGVTGPAVVVLAAALVAGGAALDLRRDATLGLGTDLAVVLAALVAPAVVRVRSLATAVVLPPLLVAGAATMIARLGGQDRGTRELVLDVGTTLALAAPLVFAATAVAVLVMLVRVGRRVLRR